MAKRIKVTNLDTLELEVARLKVEARLLERELGERGAYLKENFKGMAMNSVVPGIANSGVLGFVGKIGKLAWESGKAKSVLSTALMTALEFVAVRFGIKLANNFTTRRRRKKAERAAEKAAERGE
ncbi:hypothetical protein LX64_03701 [Chitinophaga skermanii]|uniref:Uncharacterized protein n=2 Tax=Chitinophaga skermanii TaxID=331697 RepID=A0A327QA21_9BACT|nr:hypothetical protein LX64_03701 [Chitinophaga skermanii]